METNFRVKCKSMCRKAWPFQSNLCIELLESNFPSVICLPKVPTLVQIELKVQEVLTKGIGSKISEESAYLRLASPPGCARPVWEGQWVTCAFFFSILALPTQTRELSGRQAGRQAGAVSPVQACMEHTSTCTQVLDPSPPFPRPRRSQSPGQGPQGVFAPHGKGCQQWNHFILFALVLAFLFHCV